MGDVNAWCDYLKGRGVLMTKGPKDVPLLGIRVFVFDDPEGYQIEIQQSIA